MAVFEYVARDSSGRKQKGVVSADSLSLARKDIKAKSLNPIEVKPVTDTSVKSGTRQTRNQKLSNRELVSITRQLAVLVSSGTPIEESIASIGAGVKGNKAKTIMASIRSGVIDGKPLSEALQSTSKSFSQLYCAIVRAGEETGDLGTVLERLADHLESAQEIRRKVITAMIYPIILALVTLSIVIAVLVFVIPRVVEQFESLGQSLPPLTQFMLNLSGFMQQFGLFLGVGIIIVLFVLNRLHKLEKVKRFSDQFVLSLPVVGNLSRIVSAGHFSRTFGTLAISGSPVLDCLQTARETVTNLVFRDAIDDVIENVRDGGSLSTAMASTDVFPPLLVHMTQSGEASGKLGTLLAKSANYLDAEFENASKILIGLIEPAITVIMGGLVLLIILAIMLPILQLNTGAFL